MSVRVNDGALALRICAPEHKHQVVPLCVQDADDFIRKLLPASLLVRRRLMRPYCQDCVKQQHALVRPPAEVP